MANTKNDPNQLSITGTSIQLAGYIPKAGGAELSGVRKSRMPSLSELADLFGVWRKLLINGLIILALVLIVPLTAYEIYRSQVVLEPIGMPKLLTDMGYSGDVAAHRLWDAVEAINEKAATAKEKLTLRPESRQIDIAIPETTLSFRSIGHLLRRLLSTYETRIAGEFVCISNPCKQQNLMLRLRVFDKALTIVKMGPLGHKSSDEYFHESALKLMETIDPYVVASFHLAKGELGAGRTVAEKIVQSGKSNAQWAHNLLGIIKMETDDLDGAIRQFQLALDRESGFVLAHLNWAVALARKGEHQDAIAQLQKAQNLEPRHPDIYVIRGRVLAEKENYSDAIAQFKRAIELDPKNTGGLVYLSIALARKGKFVDAIVHLEKATALDHDNAEIQAAWGAVLYFKGDHSGAIAKLNIGLSHAVTKSTKQRILKLRQMISDEFLNGPYGP